jgi:hypothetical protein
MLGRAIALILVFSASYQAHSIPNADILKNLRSRLTPQPHGGALIKSFTESTQSYVYDQALAIIAFSKAHDKKSAHSLLKALQELQMKDGSLYFSYYLDGKSPYPKEGDKRYAGAIAWVALAASHYQNEFQSKEFYSFNLKILKYLDSQMHALKIKGQSHRALSFAPSDIKSSPWKEDETAALEHNLDAYSAFLHFSNLNPKVDWSRNVFELKAFILSMWDSSRSHFWSGVNLKTGNINKHELYLDNQTWSLLALDKNTLKELNTKAALELNCDVFLIEHDGIVGFMDSKPTKSSAKTKFVWSEGSAGQILAMNRMKRHKEDSHECKDHKSDQFLASMKKMKQADGGISYATSDENPDFTTSSSVAGTAWYYFAVNDFNPFKIVPKP